MNILLTGIDGYIGWPTALRLSREFPQARIIGVDNLGRRRWVEEAGSISAIPIASMEERLAAAREQGFTNISFIPGDLVEYAFVQQLFRQYAFPVVLHLAAQPSAPYSHINGDRANFTQFNNNQATRNLLWAIKENNLEGACHFLETTTMGVYGAPAFVVPEGFVTAENQGRRDRIPFAGMAGSWYHMSKSNDANNMWLANRLWRLAVTDLRTAIVYGAQTQETAREPRLATRFDFDFYFGIVLNRFCAMALAGYPITVYGKGALRKPFISLEDCVESNVNAVKAANAGEFLVYNQATEVLSIKDLAVAIRDAGAEFGLKVDLTHIANPRVEDEEHQMEIETARFATLLPAPKVMHREGIREMVQSLLPHRGVLETYKDRFLT
ncbi:MAG: NAD-dependent epimerase/dehydratase family protein [Thermodesulfobacteriota bacterium]